MAEPVSAGKALARGLVRHCPICGSGHLFTHYFTMVADCPKCGTHFEREHGYWAGALAINIMLVGIVFSVIFVVALVLTIPEVPVLPLLLGLAPIVILGPILAYPFSKTIWVAVDRGMLQKLDTE